MKVFLFFDVEDPLCCLTFQRVLPASAGVDKIDAQNHCDQDDRSIPLFASGRHRGDQSSCGEKKKNKKKKKKKNKNKKKGAEERNSVSKPAIRGSRGNNNKNKI